MPNRCFCNCNSALKSQILESCMIPRVALGLQLVICITVEPNSSRSLKLLSTSSEALPFNWKATCVSAYACLNGAYAIIKGAAGTAMKTTKQYQN